LVPRHRRLEILVSADGPLKVSSKSNPNAVAGALAASLRERDRAELQAVGAGAINQAIKAVAIARSYLKASEIDVVCVPAFITVAIGDSERTGISLVVERRTPRQPVDKETPKPRHDKTSPQTDGETPDADQETLA
jgi:stage V sporulation protein S